MFGFHSCVRFHCWKKPEDWSKSEVFPMAEIMQCYHTQLIPRFYLLFPEYIYLIQIGYSDIGTEAAEIKNI